MIKYLLIVDGLAKCKIYQLEQNVSTLNLT